MIHQLQEIHFHAHTKNLMAFPIQHQKLVAPIFTVQILTLKQHVIMDLALDASILHPITIISIAYDHH